MRPFTKTQGSGGKRLPPSSFWCCRVPEGEKFDMAGPLEALGLSVEATSLTPPTQIHPQVLPVQRKAVKLENNWKKERRHRFLSTALVTDQRACFLALILDIESLCLNLGQWFSTKGQACARRTLKTLQRGGIQYTQAPNSLPLENQCM